MEFIMMTEEEIKQLLSELDCDGITDAEFELIKRRILSR